MLETAIQGHSRSSIVVPISCRINLEIWNQWLPWLHHGTADDKVYANLN